MRTSVISNESKNSHNVYKFLPISLIHFLKLGRERTYSNKYWPNFHKSKLINESRLKALRPIHDGGVDK